MNNNKWDKDHPFKVNLEDDGFLNPDDLEKIVPSVPQKKKFEVHIDDDMPSLESGEQQPQYKGEIYFSNRRPVKQPVRPENSQTADKTVASSRSNKNKNSSAKSLLAVFCAVVILFTTALSSIAITCINDVLAIGRSDEVVIVNVPNDATTKDIIDILADEGLIKQKLFCNFYYNLFSFFKNLNRDTKPAEPVYLSGVYYVEKNLGLEGYLTEFREIQRTADTINLVFPEGWTIYQMFDKIAEFGVCSKEELLAMSAS